MNQILQRTTFSPRAWTYGAPSHMGPAWPTVQEISLTIWPEQVRRNLPVRPHAGSGFKFYLGHTSDPPTVPWEAWCLPSTFTTNDFLLALEISRLQLSDHHHMRDIWWEDGFNDFALWKYHFVLLHMPHFLKFTENRRYTHLQTFSIHQFISKAWTEAQLVVNMNERKFHLLNSFANCGAQAQWRWRQHFRPCQQCAGILKTIRKEISGGYKAQHSQQFTVMLL